MSRRDNSRRPSLIVRNLPMDTRCAFRVFVLARLSSTTRSATAPTHRLSLCEALPMAWHTCRKEEVEDLFKTFGGIKDVYLPLNHYTRCAACTGMGAAASLRPSACTLTSPS